MSTQDEDPTPFGPAPDDLTPDEISGGAPEGESELDAEELPTIEEAMLLTRTLLERIDEEREAALVELYDGEKFETDGATFGGDLSKYDKSAYTRSKEDYQSYRYNLSTASQPQGGLYYDEYGDEYQVGYTGYGGGDSGNSGNQYNYSGSYSWGSWNSSYATGWYSGYTSTDRAIEGVHDHVATFVRAPGFEMLEIVPDLSDVERETIGAQGEFMYNGDQPNFYSRRVGFANEKGLVVRIDSTLYEKLGIAEAQQHYIVDGISQVLAAQSYPDPFLVTLLQGSSYDTKIPNVTREIITEMMRAKGLPFLLEEMPGWQKRVTAFRSAMYIGEPPDGALPSAYLMYAVWERDVVDSLEHKDAIQVIDKIEELLMGSSSYVGMYPENPGLLFNVARTQEAEQIKQVCSSRSKILKEIDKLLCDYITGFGPISELTSGLQELSELFSNKLRILEDTYEKISTDKRATEDEDDEDDEDEDEDAAKTRIPIPESSLPSGFWNNSAEKESVRKKCEALLPLILDHNRTFRPDPSTPGLVRHLDFPEAPSVSLIPEEKRKRVELTRKAIFVLERLPGYLTTSGEPCNEESNLWKGKHQIADLLKGLGIGNPSQILANLDKAVSMGGSMGGIGTRKTRTGTNCTNHPEFHSRRPVALGANRNFNNTDPDFNRSTIIFDATLAD